MYVAALPRSGAFGSAILIAILGAASARCAVTDPNHPVVKSYLNAEEVAPTWKPYASPCSGANPSSAPGWAAEPQWSTNVAAANGVTVTLTAQCRIGGDFQALYSDESQPRIILKYRDYLYPKDLRIDRSGGRAYGVASGFAGGLKLERAVLVEYDLARRQVVAEIDVDRKILPAVSWEGPTRR